MMKRMLFALWGGLFILCAGLGFIPEPAGALEKGMTTLSALFFLPPAMLLYWAGKDRDLAVIRLVRNLSLLSLGLTLLLLVVNFMTVFQAEALGTVLYYILVVVSSPMICSGNWALSMFLWAVLLMDSLRELKKQE